MASSKENSLNWKRSSYPMQAMFSLKGMHFTTRNDFHYGQWLQQKGAAPTKSGFHWKEWLPLQALLSLPKISSLKGMASTKKNVLH